MRIGTWNLDNKWTNQHRDRLQGAGCDVWLLTEVNPNAVDSQGRIEGYHCHHSADVMACGQHWAAVLSRQPLTSLPNPDPRSVAAIVNGITYCSPILPWRNCRDYPPCPWVGDTHEEMMEKAIDSLTSHLPKSNLVWGGDWNQNITGGSEHLGCIEGQRLLSEAVKRLNLQVPTADLMHQLGAGHHTIDHIGVPAEWKVTAQRIEVAQHLSDHDVYVVEVHAM